MKKNLNEIGFDTWLQLYETLKAANLHTHKEALLEWPDGPAETVQLEFIKARAFEEIYPTLPQVGAIEVLHDLVVSLRLETTNEDRTPILEFLNKITTRAND